MIPYFVSELKAQFISVGPITVVLTLFVIISRQRLIDDFWETIGGMLCAVIGLTFFLFGLKGSVMPLAEKVGTLVNEKFSLPVVLFISFVLGVLVTLAEPAVSSLRPLGRAVDPTKAPYLHYIMNDGVEWLLVSIGIGVGIAAVIGTARFVYRWPFQPMAIASTVMCLIVSGLVYWLVEDLRPVTALAWDAGAVTTGPVTVPILLALGKGAVRCHSNQPPQQTGQTMASRPPMQGFGLVTVASIYPIICVHIYGLIVWSTVSKESIAAASAAAASSSNSTTEEVGSSATVDRPPVREIVTAIRSIAPLVFVLIFLIKVVVCTDLPSVTMKDIRDQDISQAPVHSNSNNNTTATVSPEVLKGSDDEFNKATSPDGHRYLCRNQTTFDSDLDNAQSLRSLPYDDCDGLKEVETMNKCFRLEENDDEEDENHNLCKDGHNTTVETKVTASQVNHDSKGTKTDGTKNIRTGAYVAFKSYMTRECIFYESLVASQVGLIMFNIGLHYGFTSLGEQVGMLLPALYSKVEGDPDSPILPSVVGIMLANVFIFCLGILATRAEPGLKVLAEQVKMLTKSVMKRTKTVYAVALGVGLGMVAGTSRLHLEISIFPYISVMYVIAILLTLVSPEIVTKVAWDSAGVTTGPVTVPFVLSIGLAYAQSRSLPAGFGILACASVGPIITVLAAFLPWCKWKGSDSNSSSVGKQQYSTVDSTNSANTAEANVA